MILKKRQRPPLLPDFIHEYIKNRNLEATAVVRTFGIVALWQGLTF
jgi:hypothetical protein